MLSVFGYVVALSSSVPELLQLARTLRVRHVSGLSSVTLLSYALSWSAWTVYGVRLADGPVIVSSSLALVVSLSMLVVVSRLGALPRLRAAALPAAVFASAAALAWVEPRWGGVALAVAELTFFMPQMVVSFRTADLSGVSLPALLWELSTSLSWVLYTSLSGIPEAGVFSAVYSVLLAVVAWRVVRSRAAGF